MQCHSASYPWHNHNQIILQPSNNHTLSRDESFLPIYIFSNFFFVISHQSLVMMAIYFRYNLVLQKMCPSGLDITMSHIPLLTKLVKTKESGYYKEA
jgi:hypothetical protein